MVGHYEVYGQRISWLREAFDSVIAVVSLDAFNKLVVRDKIHQL